MMRVSRWWLLTLIGAGLAGRVAGRQVGWAVGALEGAIGGMCQDCDKHGLMRFMHDRLREVANRPSLMRRIGYMRIRARNQVGRSRI